VLVAIHEAGHAVAFVHFELDFNYATIIPGDFYQDEDGDFVALDPLGEVNVTPGEFTSVRDWENNLIITLAGPAAQTKQYGKSWKHYAPFGEYRKVENIIKLSGTKSHDCQAYFNYLAARADDFVEKFWDEIEAVAVALIERHTLTEDEVHDVIRSLPKKSLWHWEYRARAANCVNW
jgi:ATP-dependent Zn protease